MVCITKCRCGAYIQGHRICDTCQIKELEGELKAVMADRNKKNIQFAQHVTELEASLKAECAKWEELEKWVTGQHWNTWIIKEIEDKLAELRSQKP